MTPMLVATLRYQTAPCDPVEGELALRERAGWKTLL